VERQAGAGTLAPELVNQLIDSAAGIPLYLEQLTRTVLERREAGGQGQDGPVAITIPATLKASLAARIDNLGSAKPLLQLCSVLGFEFSYELLRAVCEASNEKLLRTVLNTIVNAGLIYQKGALPQATFKFKHRLIMEVASQSLLRRTRQQLHEVIAQKLEAQFAELCQTRPTQVAHHFNLAGNAEKAIEYWIRAAQLSQAKFANEEALAQVQRGLGALKDVADEKPRRQLEITLQSLLGAIQLASRGYTNPEVRVAFERALELSSQVEQTPALFRMVVGLWMYYLIRGEYQRARELSDQQLQIAGRIGESPELLQANYCAGYTRYYCGELTSALAFLEQGLAHSESDADFTRQTPSRDDSRIHLYCVYAAALWSSGAPQASRDYLQRALTLARELDEPYGLVWALNWAVWLEHMRGESERVARYAGEMLDISQAKGISFFVPLAMFFLASVSPDRESRLESLLTCYGMVKSAGARAGIGYMGEVVIRELIEHGELQRAREWAQDNAAGIAERGERIFLCENQRLQALLARDLDGDLEACIRQLEEAVAQARELGNLPFALAGALTLHEQAGCAARAQGLIADLLAGYAGEDDCAHYRRAREIAGDAAGLSA
jgi:tetratricopeptide (TPR) repeat protein